MKGGIMNPIIETFRKYFALKEVVDHQTLSRDGDKAWGYFDLRLLEVLIWIREGLGIPLVINTKTQQQRGLRTNICEIVKQKTLAGILYISGHLLGKAVDFNAAGNRMTAEQIRQWIRDHIDKCPWPIRLEKDVNWVHVDTCNATDQKLIEFKG